MSQLYVPDKVWLVCSDGMKKNQLKVTSQSTIKIADGRLAGTINDRFDGNFVCAKMVVAGAIIGAIAAAIFVAVTVATEGTAVAALGGAAAVGAMGAAGGAAVGGLTAMMPSICSMLCMGSQWQPVHPKVLLEKQQALIENSKINCYFGGNIMIFYSEAAAEEFTDLVMQNTAVKVGGIILGSALLSAGIAGIMTSGSTFLANTRLISSTFGSKAAFMFVGEGVGLTGIGIGASWGADQLKGIGYEAIQNGTGFKIKDYVGNNSVNEADKLLGTSSLLPQEIRELKDNFKDSLPQFAQDIFPETVQGAASVTDYLADGSGVLDGDHSPNISQYEELEYERRTIITGNGGAEEIEFDRVSNRDTRARQDLNPTSTTTTNNEAFGDRSGSYYNQETYTHTQGQQLHGTTLGEFRGKLGKSLLNAIPDADTFKKPALGEKRPFPIEIAIDAYNILSNWLLEGAIDDYKEAKNIEEEVRKGITVIENTQ